MTWLPESEFRRLHRKYHQSAEAKTLKRRLYAKQGGCCARCSLPLPRWGGVLNLTTYEGMNRGHVPDSQANLLHRGCHPQGTYTWQKLAADRAFDRDRVLLERLADGVLWIICLLPFLLWKLFVALTRAARRGRRGRRG